MKSPKAAGEGSDLMEHPADYLARTGDSRQIVEPEDNEVFVDIDGFDAADVFDIQLAKLQEFMPCRVTRRTPSATHGHEHVVVTFERVLDPVLRIALQACLGSDRMRELLSLLRILLEMNRPPTVFFEEV